MRPCLSFRTMPPRLPVSGYFSGSSNLCLSRQTWWHLKNITSSFLLSNLSCAGIQTREDWIQKLGPTPMDSAFYSEVYTSATIKLAQRYFKLAAILSEQFSILELPSPSPLNSRVARLIHTHQSLHTHQSFLTARSLVHTNKNKFNTITLFMYR